MDNMQHCVAMATGALVVLHEILSCVKQESELIKVKAKNTEEKSFLWSQCTKPELCSLGAETHMNNILLICSCPFQRWTAIFVDSTMGDDSISIRLWLLYSFFTCYCGAGINILWLIISTTSLNTQSNNGIGPTMGMD